MNFIYNVFRDLNLRPFNYGLVLRTVVAGVVNLCNRSTRAFLFFFLSQFFLGRLFLLVNDILFNCK